VEVMKQLRQRAIRDLVEQRTIRTQQELAAALRERGFRTTQATISRDVAELGLVKAGRGGTHAYAIPPLLREADTSGEDRIRTGRGGRRWWARSRATTRCSWRSRTAGRWGA
jgi:arginine repressor